MACIVNNGRGKIVEDIAAMELGMGDFREGVAKVSDYLLELTTRIYDYTTQSVSPRIMSFVANSPWEVWIWILNNVKSAYTVTDVPQIKSCSFVAFITKRLNKFQGPRTYIFLR